MDSQQLQNKMGSSPSQAADHLYLGLGVMCACVTPFIRKGFGTKSPGVCGLFAFILLLVMCSSVPDMYGDLLLWCVYVVAHRISTLRDACRGVVVHSHYDGEPWIAMKIRWVRTELAARLIAEPLICLGIGGLLYTVCPPFGQFIMACAGALFIKCLVEMAITHKRLQRMRDAAIEQRWYSDRFRKGGKSP